MKTLSVIAFAVFLVVLLSFILSYPVMLLWNGCLVDAVSVVKPITWLQAWGLTILVKLFSGVGAKFDKPSR